MRYAMPLAALIVVIAVLASLKGAQIATLVGFGEEMQKLGPPPEAVNSARAELQDWERTLSAVASVVSRRSLTLTNEVAGSVRQLSFESGERVRRGQRLLELDSDVEQAQLASLRARLVLAARTLRRTRRLTVAGANAQAELDAARSEHRSLRAQARALAAQIARKTVRAPFSGKLGIRQVNLGQYLAPGTALTELESNQGIFIDFSLPQQELPSLALGQAVRVRAQPGARQLAAAQISALGAGVDEVTRTIDVRARVVGGAERLQSGMFVHAEVLLAARARVVAVPATAVVHGPAGDSVFRVELTPAVRVARQQLVRLGGARGDYVAVLEGVRAGDEVVTAGAFKLRDRAPISIKNEVQPRPLRDPRPENR